MFVRIFVFVFIIGSTCLSQHHRRADYDFPQFYLGGLVARLGEWNALYPIPHPDSVHNPGLSADSDLKLRTAQICAEYHVPDKFRFIQMPIVALFFAPLSLLSFDHALWLWIILAGCFSSVTAILAGEIYGVLTASANRTKELVVIVVATSQFIYRSVRAPNVSAFMGLCIAWAVYELIRTKGKGAGRAALPILIGGFIKYATLIDLPLLAAKRAWLYLTCTIVGGLVIVLLSMMVTGTSVYREFGSTIWPRLDRPFFQPGNQGLEGTLLRAIGTEPPLPTKIRALLRATQMAVLLLICAGLFLRDWCASPIRPTDIVAGAAALTAWLLLFSPVAWDHYYVYTCGFWGWLAFEAGRNKLRRVLVICMVPVWLIDSPGTPGMVEKLRWPLGEHLQVGLVLMLVVALIRLNSNKRHPIAAPMPLAAAQETFRSSR